MNVYSIIKIILYSLKIFIVNFFILYLFLFVIELYFQFSKKTLFSDSKYIYRDKLIKKYNENGVISNFVKYPTKLNMNSYCLNYKEKSTNYELSGLIIHNGGLNSGHYYSICKNTLENKWKVYNDTNVYNIDQNKIFDNHPYCLFYKRV